MPSKLSKLLVVSHVVHYRHEGAIYGYGPYTREVDIWADLFPQVVIAAPCRDGRPPGDAVPFTRSNISMHPQKETGGKTLGASVRQLLALPQLVGTLSLAMWQADAIHVRCPGNLGLLGSALAPLFSRYRIAKYAGQWNGYEGEPLSVRLQRAILASSWWGSPVTVYGDWPNQPSHVVPFFTSMMTADQQRHAADVAAEKRIGSPLRILFSGMLEPRKRVSALIDAVSLVVKRGLDVSVAVVGDGAERDRLRRQVAELGLDETIRFVGALPFDQSLKWYEWAHCLVLPSRHSEGWPKVVAEGMSHGLVCMAVNHGHVPAMLRGRGIVLPTGTAEEMADALMHVSAEPAKYNQLAQHAAEWATTYSLEGLRSALTDLLADRWGVERQSLCAQGVL